MEGEVDRGEDRVDGVERLACLVRRVGRGGREGGTWEVVIGVSGIMVEIGVFELAKNYYFPSM